MSDQITLAQLAAEMAQLRQQIEQVNQRLDMIYGAVTRLAETRPGTPIPSAEPVPRRQPAPAPSPASAAPLSAEMMMDPGSMLVSLHQYALNAGLNLSSETVDRLKAELQTGEKKDETD
jgi:hypothetical protein